MNRQNIYFGRERNNIAEKQLRTKVRKQLGS